MRGGTIVGVLIGRFPGKVKEGIVEQGKKRLVEALNSFITFAEKFGVAVNEREVHFRKDTTGNKILAGLDNYGVTACNIGTNFWKYGK